MADLNQPSKAWHRGLVSYPIARTKTPEQIQTIQDAIAQLKQSNRALAVQSVRLVPFLPQQCQAAPLRSSIMHSRCCKAASRLSAWQLPGKLPPPGALRSRSWAVPSPGRRQQLGVLSWMKKRTLLVNFNTSNLQCRA